MVFRRARISIGRHRSDAAHDSAFFSYLIFVLGQSGAHTHARALYQRYLESIPESHRRDIPVGILSALMVVNLKEKAYEEVQKCWNLAFQQAEEQGRSIDFQKMRKNPRILPLHQLALNRPLSTQISSLIEQRKTEQLCTTVEKVQAAGFVLDNKNWNLYIQGLAVSSRCKEAFTLCEGKLMDGWTGWARLRWSAPQRNRLPLGLRYERMRAGHLRPLYYTLLSLAKAYVELGEASAEREGMQHVLDNIEKECPRTVHAIKSMQMVHDNLQRKFLGR